MAVTDENETSHYGCACRASGPTNWTWPQRPGRRGVDENENGHRKGWEGQQGIGTSVLCPVGNQGFL